MYRFTNRSEAGKQLALELKKFSGTKSIVLAVPRGGVPVAYEVAKALNLPMEVILVKKLGHPLNKEYAIGAVGPNESFVVPHEGVNEFYLLTETKKIRQRLKEMKEKFMSELEPEDLRGKTVIVIDDGIATGKTLLATIRIIKKSEPTQIIVAVPVISKSALELLTPEVDEVIAVIIPEIFQGVGAFYHDFSQLTDEEVVDYLQRFSNLRKVG